MAKASHSFPSGLSVTRVRRAPPQIFSDDQRFDTRMGGVSGTGDRNGPETRTPRGWTEKSPPGEDDVELARRLFCMALAL